MTCGSLVMLVSLIQQLDVESHHCLNAGCLSNRNSEYLSYLVRVMDHLIVEYCSLPQEIWEIET